MSATTYDAVRAPGAFRTGAGTSPASRAAAAVIAAVVAIVLLTGIAAVATVRAAGTLSLRARGSVSAGRARVWRLSGPHAALVAHARSGARGFFLGPARRARLTLHAGPPPAGAEILSAARPVAIEPAAGAPPEAGTAPAAGVDLGEFDATCYALEGRTASGRAASSAGVAVDPAIIPLGTRLYVQGVGERVADDTGGSIVGRRIDVWEPSAAACTRFGTRMLDVRRLAS